MWGNRITLWDLGSGVLFPQPVAIEDTDLAAYAMPEPRRDALRSLARALAGGEIVLDPGADREEAGRRPVDRLLRGDANAGRPRRVPAHGSRGPALARFGQASDPAGVDARAERWRPWRAYAVQHLWAAQDQMPMIKQRETRKEVVA
jgi:AraC family transcriptional regulator of adaptative response / DNA-3-methyladenine glycosylase II